MLKFLIKRICESIPVFFIIITAVFFMVRFVPGGPFDRERPVSAETLEALNAYYGLNEPLAVQYVKFLGNLFKGELGPSYRHEGWDVSEILCEKAAVSLELGAYALLIAIFVGFALGLASALKGKLTSASAAATSLVGICLPSFVLGPILILIFSTKLKLFNSRGWGSFSEAILPSITLALFYAAWVARLTGAEVRTQIAMPYVRTARAKGLSERKILFVHVLRNAVQPAIAYLGPAAAGLMTGSFVVETIFQISGLGKFFISSALDNDYTMIMGCVMLYASFILIFNILSDLAMAVVNPKIARELKK